MEENKQFGLVIIMTAILVITAFLFVNWIVKLNRPTLQPQTIIKPDEVLIKIQNKDDKLVHRCEPNGWCGTSPYTYLTMQEIVDLLHLEYTPPVETKTEAKLEFK